MASQTTFENFVNKAGDNSSHVSGCRLEATSFSRMENTYYSLLIFNNTNIHDYRCSGVVKKISHFHSAVSVTFVEIYAT